LLYVLNMALPEPISRLISALSKLPGIGPRSAERITLHLVQCEPGSVKELADALLAARERVTSCAICGALTEKQPCAICSDARRDSALVCVVERPVDILSIEKSESYRGKYHVLGGKISPLNGVAAEDLRIRDLEARLQTEPIKEIIIALPSDVEGDATSYYLAHHFAVKGVKTTRIAHGLPVGSGLEFADGITLGRAIEGRRPFEP
jgi:recombination protein RecR